MGCCPHFPQPSALGRGAANGLLSPFSDFPADFPWGEERRMGCRPHFPIFLLSLCSEDEEDAFEGA